MADLEAVIDDYLHTIVRSQPWIKKQEEELLTAFQEWLSEQPGMSRELSAVVPATVARYVAAEELSAAEHEALNTALQHLFAWAEYQQLVPNNPFAASTAA